MPRASSDCEVCRRTPRSTCASVDSPPSSQQVDEQADLHPVGRDERHLLQGRPAAGVLAAQRLHEPGELRPQRVEQRPGGQLGDPAPAGRLDEPVDLERPRVAALHVVHLPVGEQRAEQPGDVVGDVAEQVGVEEDDEVAGGGGQRLPQRLALAGAGAVRGQHVGGGDDVGAGGTGDGGRASVESESTTSSSSTSGTRRIQRSCRSPTRWPTVASSLRAGRTTDTRCPPRRLARSRESRSISDRPAAEVVRCWNQARASGRITTLSTLRRQHARSHGRVHADVTPAGRNPGHSDDPRHTCGLRVRSGVMRARPRVTQQRARTGRGQGSVAEGRPAPRSHSDRERRHVPDQQSRPFRRRPRARPARPRRPPRTLDGEPAAAGRRALRLGDARRHRDVDLAAHPRSALGAGVDRAPGDRPRTKRSSATATGPA